MEPGGFDSFIEQPSDMHFRFDPNRIVSLLDDDDLELSSDIYTKIFIGGLNSDTTNGKYIRIIWNVLYRISYEIFQPKVLHEV
jgi:hypothetical protein